MPDTSLVQDPKIEVSGRRYRLLSMVELIALHEGLIATKQPHGRMVILLNDTYWVPDANA